MQLIYFLEPISFYQILKLDKNVVFFCSKKLSLLKKSYCFFRVFFLLTILISNDYKSQTVNFKLDSILIKQSEILLSQNTSRKDIIKWNLDMLKKAKKENYERGIVIIYTNLANQYYNLGKPDLSLSYLNKAKQMAEKSDVDSKILSKVYQEFSQVYFTMGLFDMSLLYNSKSKYYAEQIDEKKYKHWYLNFIYRTRSITLAKAKKDSVLFYIRKSINVYDAPQNYVELANYYINQDKYLDSAKIYLLKAEKMYSKIKNVNRYSLAVMFYNFGMVSSKEKKYDEAIDFLEKSRSYASNGKNRQFLISVYTLLAENYKNVGNAKKEKQVLDEYKEFVDSYDKSYSKGVEITVKNLEQENEREKEKLLVIVSVATLLVIVVFGIYFYKNHRKKQKIIQEKDQIIYQQKSESIQLEKKVIDKFDELYELAISRDPNFYNKFHNLNADFVKKLLDIAPNLQNSELQLLAYIYLKLETKEIADILYLSPKTIQNRKYNVRKKLNIPSSTSVYIWLISLDLEKI